MKSLLTIIALLLACTLADGEMFHCLAEDGPVTAKDTLAPAASKNERFSGTVEIYVTDWCGYCRQAQSYMKSKGIPYVAYDIEKDSAANQRHKAMGGRGVPLIIIGSNRMSGFSAKQLEYYLNNSK
jgi:glutaredoxin-like YruB-family protein